MVISTDQNLVAENVGDRIRVQTVQRRAGNGGNSTAVKCGRCRNVLRNRTG